MRNIFMVVSYDGTAYCGFQQQPGLPTVQGKLQEAVLHLTGEQVKIEGSGRTDAGVHARGQAISFLTSALIPVERWKHAMNARLPADIVVREAREAPLTLHARHSALRKTYRYTLNNNRTADVFRRKYQYQHYSPLNVDAMRESLPYLLGEHDFSSFCSRHSTKKSHVRRIDDIHLEQELTEDDGPDGCGLVHLYVTGNGFLYNMVRVIVGTLIQIGEGKRKPEEMKHILDAKDRSAAGPTAEAHGLCLWNVEYNFS